MTEITLTEFARVAIADVDRQNDFLREKIAQSTELLRKLAKPDTFLGRRTQEPFPKEARW